MSDFDLWFPIRVFRFEDELRVQWFRRDENLRFDDRFFHETVERAAKRPFNLAFFRETGVDVLQSIVTESPSLPVAGFIAHLSRCGSTLVSSAFLHRDDTLVLSEAGPINDVLCMSDLDADERVELLQSVVAVLCRPQRTRQNAAVVKLDAWHAMHLDSVERAFPNTPWVFVHRAPVEVLVSHLQTPSFMMSAANARATLGTSVVEAMRVPREVHCANVLGTILQSIERRAPQRDALIDYRDLPDAVWTRIGPRFGLPFSDVAIQRIRAASAYHAKARDRAFTPDSDAKRQAAQVLPAEIPGFLERCYAWFQRATVQ